MEQIAAKSEAVIFRKNVGTPTHVRDWHSLDFFLSIT